MRILAVQSKSILAEGLNSLLMQSGSFDVKSSRYQSKKRLMEEIDGYQPEVIIFDQDLGTKKLGALFSLLESRPHIRLLVINPTNNQVQVYEKLNQPVNFIDDLIKVIQGETIES